jgi:hypothetical protein
VALRAIDAIERVGLCLGYRTLDAHLEDLHVARDRVQGRAQLVAHDGEEVRLRAIRGFGGLAQAL